LLLKIKMDTLERYNIKELTVEGDKIFLKKSKYFNWKVVHPYRIDGKINWKNLIAGGNWFNLLWIALIIGIILGCLYEYSVVLKSLNECSKSLPIKFAL